LIVPRLMYKAAHQYRITVNGNQQAVLAGDAIHKHRGWVGFEIDM